MEEGTETIVHSSIGFDLTITSLFLPLLAGGRIRLLAESAGLEEIVTAIRSPSDFNLLKITPSHLEGINHLLIPAEVSGRIRTLILGGEALFGKTLAVWNRHAPEPKIINEYGPTETVVGCCVYEVPKGNSLSGPVPIGRPISNMQMYLLDGNLQLVPIGAPGGVFIGGAGLARGYQGRPDLTAEKFIPHPYSKEANARLYKTGDLARYQPDGTIDYLGRLDHQVKIRGFRIELGEIEAALVHHPAVQDAVVLCREDSHGTKQLVGYMVATETGRPATTDLLAWLKRTLPDYMLPSVFVFLESLPLTLNGKVDRKALLVTGPAHRIRATAYVQPRTPLEELLAEIWRHLLKVDQISVHDNFFAVGGHSLLATKVIARLRHALELDIPLRTLFEHPTLAQLARAVDLQLANTFPDWPRDESPTSSDPSTT